MLIVRALVIRVPIISLRFARTFALLSVLVRSILGLLFNAATTRSTSATTTATPTGIRVPTTTHIRRLTITCVTGLIRGSTGVGTTGHAITGVVGKIASGVLGVFCGSDNIVNHGFVEPGLIKRGIHIRRAEHGHIGVHRRFSRGWNIRGGCGLVAKRRNRQIGIDFLRNLVDFIFDVLAHAVA